MLQISAIFVHQRGCQECVKKQNGHFGFKKFPNMFCPLVDHELYPAFPRIVKVFTRWLFPPVSVLGPLTPSALIGEHWFMFF